MTLRSRSVRSILVLTLAATAAVAAKPVPGPAPLTSGPNYDRNPAVLADGRDVTVFFTRTQAPCNRLQGCPADNSRYDLWSISSRNDGRTWGAAQLEMTNPGDASFYGRTIAAVPLPQGGTAVYWASGGGPNALHVLTRPDAGSPWTLTTLTDHLYFNVEAVTDGSTIFVYYEDAMGGIFVRTTPDGTTLGPSALAYAARSIPKVTIDQDGVFRMTMVDPSSWPAVDVLVGSSPDGLAWGPEQSAVQSDGLVANWDPVISQDRGTYTMTFAPDLNDGRQRIESVQSGDFQTWTSRRVLTEGTDGTTSYWEYWPEASTRKGGLLYASEAPVGADPAGTGHIWRLPGR